MEAFRPRTRVRRHPLRKRPSQPAIRTNAWALERVFPGSQRASQPGNRIRTAYALPINTYEQETVRQSCNAVMEQMSEHVLRDAAVPQTDHYADQEKTDDLGASVGAQVVIEEHVRGLAITKPAEGAKAKLVKQATVVQHAPDTQEPGLPSDTITRGAARSSASSAPSSRSMPQVPKRSTSVSASSAAVAFRARAIAPPRTIDIAAPVRTKLSGTTSTAPSATSTAPPSRATKVHAASGGAAAKPTHVSTVHTHRAGATQTTGVSQHTVTQATMTPPSTINTPTLSPSVSSTGSSTASVAPAALKPRVVVDPAAAIRSAIAESKHNRALIEARGDQTRQLQAALQAALDQITKIELEFTRFKAAAEHDRMQYAAVLDENARLRSEMASIAAQRLKSSSSQTGSYHADTGATITLSQHARYRSGTTTTSGDTDGGAESPDAPVTPEIYTDDGAPLLADIVMASSPTSSKSPVSTDIPKTADRLTEPLVPAGARPRLSSLTNAHLRQAASKRHSSEATGGSGKENRSPASLSSTIDSSEQPQTPTSSLPRNASEGGLSTPGSNAMSPRSPLRSSSNMSASSSGRKPFERALSVRLLSSDRSSRTSAAAKRAVEQRNGLTPVRRALSASCRSTVDGGSISGASSSQSPETARGSRFGQHSSVRVSTASTANTTVTSATELTTESDCLTRDSSDIKEAVGVPPTRKTRLSRKWSTCF